MVNPIVHMRLSGLAIPVYAVLLALFCPALLTAEAKQIDDYNWTGVERVVAIGDLHGDYQQYIKVMRSAGLIDSKGRWSGGKTHLVQTGDVTDRGADSRKIIDHLIKLGKQAKKKGGYVHTLIGNHESMNVTGDLRYVSAGEFEAFTSRKSPRYQEMQWQRQVDWLQSNDPEAFATLDLEAYRLEWEQRVPLGWVEHRQAWSLGGEYGKWVKGNPVAIQINDTIFLHGGISAKYCRFSLESLTRQSMAAMENYDYAVSTIIDDPLGPLWYRGLALEQEAEVFSQTLDNILERYSAKRIVVGHTPTGGIVWPRFDQRVIVNDTGIAAHYGSHKGVLELTADGATAIYADRRIPVPPTSAEREAYLRVVIGADSNNAELKQRLARMLAPPADESPVIEIPGPADGDVEAIVDEVGALEITPGTCQ